MEAAPRIVNPGATWRRAVSFKRQPLYPRGKEPTIHMFLFLFMFFRAGWRNGIALYS
jgi:hypothetical protein